MLRRRNTAGLNRIKHALGKKGAAMPVACLAASEADVGRLIAESEALSSEKGFVLLLDEKKGIAERLLPAYLNASVRFSEGGAKAARIQLEMLLFVCGSMKIETAISGCGIKRNSRFILFATSERLLKDFLKKTASDALHAYSLAFDPDIASAVSSEALMH